MSTEFGGSWTSSPVEAPPQVEQLSLGAGPVAIPSSTTLANLLPLIYTLSADLSTSVTPTGNTTNTSNSITSLSSTAGLVVGMTISGAGIPASSVITSISGTTITINNAATATATGVTLTCAVVQSWQLIDGTTMLCTFSGPRMTQVRVQFQARPYAPSTMVAIYPY